MAIYSFILLGLGLVFCYYVKVYVEACWRLRGFRGPFALPLLGNCYNPSVIISLFKFMANLRKQYGKVFTLFLFNRAYLVILDPAIVRRVLSDSKQFPKGPNYVDQFSIVFGQGLVTSENEKHRHDKGVFGKYFVRNNILDHIDMMNAYTAEGVNQYVTQAMGQRSELNMNVEHLFAKLALRIFMRFSINSDYRDNPKREEEICHMVSKGSYYMGFVIAFSVPNWSFIPMIKFLNNVRTEVWRDAKVLLDIRRKKLQNGECSDLEKQDVLTAMIENDLTELDMKDQLVSLICAGHDTTAFFSSYLCLVLAENPEVQTQLRQVVETQMGERTEVTGDDLSSMKYLTQVMHETLRLFAIIPNLSRVSAADVVIKEADNIMIPKGTDLMIPMYLLNRDPEIWDNPSKFDPSRWDNKGDFTSAKDGFFPFGYGSRTCTGNMLAQIESAVFICHLLRKFDILPEPGFKVSIIAGISLTTSNGVKVIFRKR